MDEYLNVISAQDSTEGVVTTQTFTLDGAALPNYYTANFEISPNGLFAVTFNANSKYTIYLIDMTTNEMEVLAGSGTAGGGTTADDGIGTAAKFVNSDKAFAWSLAGDIVYVGEGSRVRSINMQTKQVTTVYTGYTTYVMRITQDGFMVRGTNSGIREHQISSLPGGTSLNAYRYCTTGLPSYVLQMAISEDESTIYVYWQDYNSGSIFTSRRDYTGSCPWPGGSYMDWLYAFTNTYSQHIISMTMNSNSIIYAVNYYQVYKIDVNAETVTSVAGTNTPGNADGTGTSATFDNPQHISMSSNGRYLWVVDDDRQHVRRITTGVAYSSEECNACPPNSTSAGGSVTECTWECAVDMFVHTEIQGNPTPGVVTTAFGPNLYQTYQDIAVFTTGSNLGKALVISQGTYGIYTWNLETNDVTPFFDLNSMSHMPSCICLNADNTKVYYGRSYYLYQVDINTPTHEGRVGTLSQGSGAVTGCTVDSDGNIYTTGGTDIKKVSNTEGSWSVATQWSFASLGYKPTDVIISADKSTLYWTDEQNKALYKTDISSTTSQTAQLVADSNMYFPYSLTFSSADETSVFISAYHQIWKADLNSPYTLEVFAGPTSGTGNVDGTGTDARFNQLKGMAISNDYGTLYVADRANYALRTVTTGYFTSTESCQACEPGSESPGGNATSCTCVGGYHRAGVEVTVPNDPLGATTTLFGEYDVPSPGVNGDWTAAKFYYPTQCVILPADDGRFALCTERAATNYGGRIRKLDLVSGAVTTFAGAGSGSADTDGTGVNAVFSYPAVICANSDGSVVYVASTRISDNMDRITSIVVETQVVTTIMSLGTYNDGTVNTVERMEGCAVTEDDEYLVYGTDYSGIHKVRISDQTGSGETGKYTYPDTTDTNNGMGELSIRGNILVYSTRTTAVSSNRAVYKIDLSTNTRTFVAGAWNTNTDGMGSSASFENGYGVGVQVSLDGLTAYIGTNAAIRIVNIDETSADFGQVTTLAGSVPNTGATASTGYADSNDPSAVRFNRAYGLALYANSNNLLVCDYFNQVVRKVSLGPSTATAFTGPCTSCDPGYTSLASDANTGGPDICFYDCPAGEYAGTEEVVTTATAPYTITWVLEDADEGLTGGSSPDQSCDEICAEQNMVCDQTTLDGPIRHNNEAPALLFLEDIISASAYSGLSGSNGYNEVGSGSNECQIVPYFYTSPGWGYGYWVPESREQYACTQTSQCSVKASDIPLSTSYNYQRLCPCYSATTTTLQDTCLTCPPNYTSPALSTSPEQCFYDCPAGEYAGTVDVTTSSTETITNPDAEGYTRTIIGSSDVLGSGHPGIVPNGLYYPQGLAISPVGDWGVIANKEYNEIVVFSLGSTIEYTTYYSGISSPLYVCFHPDGDRLYVMNTGYMYVLSGLDSNGNSGTLNRLFSCNSCTDCAVTNDGVTLIWTDQSNIYEAPLADQIVGSYATAINKITKPNSANALAFDLAPDQDRIVFTYPGGGLNHVKIYSRSAGDVIHTLGDGGGLDHLGYNAVAQTTSTPPSTSWSFNWPYDVAISHDGKSAYVSTYYSVDHINIDENSPDYLKTRRLSGGTSAYTTNIVLAADASTVEFYRLKSVDISRDGTFLLVNHASNYAYIRKISLGDIEVTTTTLVPGTCGASACCETCPANYTSTALSTNVNQCFYACDAGGYAGTEDVTTVVTNPLGVRGTVTTVTSFSTPSMNTELAFVGTDNAFIYYSSSATLYKTEISTNTPYTVKDFGANIMSLAGSPAHSNLIMVAYGTTICVYDIAADTCIFTKDTGYSTKSGFVAMSRDGTAIAYKILPPSSTGSTSICENSMSFDAENCFVTTGNWAGDNGGTAFTPDGQYIIASNQATDPRVIKITRGATMTAVDIGDPAMMSPRAGVVEPNGNILVMEHRTRLWQYDTTTSLWSVLAGKDWYSGTGTVDGVGTAAEFYFPYGIALTHDGSTLYVRGTSTIRKVSLGDISTTTTHDTCLTCPTGRTSPALSTSADACGCYADWYDHDGTCAQCPANSVSPVGSVGVTSCECAAGFTGTITTSTDTCTACLDGMYKASVGSADCIFCNITGNEHTNPNSGHTQCYCNAGHYRLTTDATDCQACPPGTFEDHVNNDLTCQACRYGSSTEATGADTENYCKCIPGFENEVHELDVCSECDIGKYRLGYANLESCTTCPVGSTTTETGADEVADCECAAGYTGSGGSTCTECDANSYKSSVGNVACDACNTGATSPTGSTATTHCACTVSGYTGANGTQCVCDLGHTGTDCEQCDVNTYKDVTGDAACSDCDPNAISPAGSTASTACQCDVGYHGQNGGLCTECDANYYKDSVGDALCTGCPNNTHSLAASDSRDDCLADAGYYGFGSSVSACPPNSHSDTESTQSTDCKCNQGYTGPDGGACVACVEGTFKNVTGSGFCYSCGGDAYHSLPGSDSEDDCVCAAGYKSHTVSTGSSSGSVLSSAVVQQDDVSFDGSNSVSFGTLTFHIQSNGGMTIIFKVQKHINQKMGLWTIAGFNAWFPTRGFGTPYLDISHGCSMQSGSGSDPNVIQNNFWYTVVARYDLDTQIYSYTIYEPDESVHYSSPSCNIGGLTDITSTDNTIGWYDNSDHPHGTANNKLDGDIAGFYVWDRYLTDSEVSAARNAIIINGVDGSSAAADISSPACVACEQGTYNAATNVTVCESCHEYANTSTTGSTTATDCYCNAGYIGDGLSCDACAQGTYQDETGTTVCKNCNLNAQSDPASDAVTDCVCNAGYAGDDGNACTQCTAGTYEDITFNNCSTCPDNSISVAASDDVTDCQCNAGYKGPNGGTCNPCLSTEYQNEIGQSSCEACPDNTTSLQASDANTDCVCNSGYTGPDGGPCQACAAGKFKATSGSSECTDCADNSQSDAGASVCLCNAGFYADANDCQQCDGGTYKDTPGSESCTSCPTNTHSTPASDHVTDCTCNTGYTASEDGEECTVCASGQYKNFTGTGNCIYCDVNANSDAGSDEPTDCVCNAGYAGINGAVCEACEAGKYEDVAADTCVNCPNHSTSISGSAAETDCLCNPGYTGPNAGPCDECAVNTFKDTAGSAACTPCTPFSTSLAGSDNETDCVCNSGYKKVDDQSCDLECAPGFEAGPNELHCYGCQENYYKDTTGDHTCTQCPPNSYHNLRNQTSIDSCICQWGYIKSEDGLTCNECPAGTFNNQNGESECFDCYWTPPSINPLFAEALIYQDDLTLARQYVDRADELGTQDINFRQTGGFTIVGKFKLIDAGDGKTSTSYYETVFWLENPKRTSSHANGQAHITLNRKQGIRLYTRHVGGNELFCDTNGISCSNVCVLSDLPGFTDTYSPEQWHTFIVTYDTSTFTLEMTWDGVVSNKVCKPAYWDDWNGFYDDANNCGGWHFPWCEGFFDADNAYIGKGVDIWTSSAVDLSGQIAGLYVFDRKLTSSEITSVTNGIVIDGTDGVSAGGNECVHLTDSTSKTDCSGLCQAPPGYQITTSGSNLEPCPSNTFNYGSLTQCLTCPSVSTYTSLTGSTSLLNCSCTAGHSRGTSPDNNHICLPCAQGSFKSTTGDSPCDICPNNTNTSDTASDSPTDCLCVAGYELVDGTCQPCGAGEAKFVISNAACIDCHDHSTLVDNGNHAVSSCLCDAGYTGTHVSGCEACPANTYKSTVGSDLCSNCTEHASSPPASVTITACTCDAPAYVADDPGPDVVGGTCKSACTEGQTLDNGVCVPCAEGTYKNFVGGDACRSCSSPRNASAPGSDSADDCSCRAGEMGLAGTPVVISSLNGLSDSDILTTLYSASQTVVGAHQPFKQLSLHAASSTNSHVTATINDLLVFKCTTDCDQYGTVSLHGLTGTLQLTFTGGSIQVQQHTRMACTFDSTPAWLNVAAAEAHVLEYSLLQGDFLFDSTTELFSDEVCVACVPGLVCTDFIVE